MADDHGNTIARRELLVKTVPACAAACFMLGRVPGTAAWAQEQDQHKFDVPRDRRMSGKQSVQMEYAKLFDFIRTLQGELEEPELIRLLNKCSADNGRRVGARPG